MLIIACILLVSNLIIHVIWFDGDLLEYCPWWHNLHFVVALLAAVAALAMEGCPRQ